MLSTLQHILKSPLDTIVLKLLYGNPLLVCCLCMAKNPSLFALSSLITYLLVFILGFPHTDSHIYLCYCNVVLLCRGLAWVLYEFAIKFMQLVLFCCLPFVVCYFSSLLLLLYYSVSFMYFYSFKTFVCLHLIRTLTVYRKTTAYKKA